MTTETITTESSEDLGTERAPAPRRRLHWTTWLLGTFVLLVCVLMNVGGDYNPKRQMLEYGWPWMFGSGDFKTETNLTEDNMFDFVRLFRVDKINQYQSGALALNTTMGVVLILLIPAAWEIRFRSRKRLWQFAIADWFYFCLAFALVYGWIMDLYNDRNAEFQLTRSLKRRNIEIFSNNLLEFNFALPWDCDAPCDWFWQTANVPVALQPWRRESLELIVLGKNENAEFPREAVQALQKMKQLRSLNLSSVQINFPRNTWPIASLGKNLHNLSLKYAMHLPDEAIGRSETLTQLDITNAPNFRGHHLAELPNLKILLLNDTALDDSGCEQIGKLTRLKTLVINGKANVSDAGWRALGNLASLDKIVFSDAIPISAESLAVLKSLPKLKQLTVYLSRFDRAWIDQLHAIPIQLKTIEFRGQQPAQKLTFSLGLGEEIDEQGLLNVQQAFAKWEAKSAVSGK